MGGVGTALTRLQSGESIVGGGLRPAGIFMDTTRWATCREFEADRIGRRGPEVFGKSG